MAQVFVLLLAGCDTGLSDGGGGGGVTIDPDLVGKWYQTQAAADAGGNDFLFEFTTGGQFTVVGQQGVMKVTTSDDKISATATASGAPIDYGSASYDVNVTALTTTLTFSKPTGGTPNIFSILTTAQSPYYKAAIKVAKPTASPAAGAVASGTPVTLSTTTAEAAIYYTINGSEPTAQSTLYSAPITITTTTTIKAIAVKAGMTNSDILEAAYTAVANKVITPTASPAAGAVTSGTQITLSTLTLGAAIHYTTDGSAPTADSTRYSDSDKPTITGTGTTTIKAIAVKTDMTDSDILTAAYTILTAPTNVTAEAQSSSIIKVTWDAVTGASGYRVYRGTSSGGENTKIGDVPSGSLYIIDTGLVPSTTYYYKVNAYNSAGESAKSDSASATTLSANPFPNTKWIMTGSFGAFMEFKDASNWVMGGSKAVKGTYTANGNTASLIVTHDWDDDEGWEPISPPIESTATLSGNTLTGSDDKGNPMTFTKWTASGGSPNPFTGTWTGTVEGHSVTVNITDFTVETVGQAKGGYSYNGNTAVCTVTDFWNNGNGSWQPVGTNGPPPYPVTVSGNTLTAYYNGNIIPLTKGGGSGDDTAPYLESAVVENAAPSQLVLTFSEAVTADNANGWSGTGATFAGSPSGLGTKTWKIPLTASVSSDVVLSVSYDSAAGNTRNLAENALVSFTLFPVINNVGQGPFVGAWMGTVDDESVTVYITADENKWITVGKARGTYTTSGNDIVFTMTDAWATTYWVAVTTQQFTLTLSGDGTTLTGSIIGGESGTFTKGVVGDGVPKTLVITDIPATVWHNQVSLGVFVSGTPTEQAFQQNGIVAGVSSEDRSIIVQRDGPYYTLIIPIHVIGAGSIPWTRSGGYDVYVVLPDGEDGARYYKAGVTFPTGTTPGTTTIAFSSLTELTLPTP
jgi:hypothetical protein